MNRRTHLLRRVGQALGFLLIFTAARPCGPFVPTFYQVVQSIPDGCRQDWLEGRIGLIQPSLGTVDLVVAWRWLSGIGFNRAEQEALLAGPIDGRSGSDVWKKARAEAGAAPLEIKEGTVDSDYTTTRRIGNHALLLAADTLQARMATFGKQSPAVKSWLVAQDQVFAWDKPELPAVAAPDLPLIIRQDRAYQRAAALYYRQRGEEASKAFAELAKDGANPWHGWARYMVARQTEVGEAREEGDPLDVETLVKPLRDLQKAPYPAELRKAAAALENRRRYQGDPVAFYAWLLGNLARKDRGEGLAQDIEDLRWLRVMEPWDKELKDTRPKGVHAWIDLMQKGDLDAALAAYDADPGLPNLVAVMQKLKADHPRVESFLKRAQAAGLGSAAVSGKSPAYATLVHHRLRILVAQKRMKAAEALADEALGHPDAARWPSSFNLWSSIKVACARDMDGLATHLGRRLASIDDGEGLFGQSETPRFQARLEGFDPAVAERFNRQVPLAQWEALVACPRFPADLKPVLLETLWTRAAILGREDLMGRLQPALCKALREALVPQNAPQDAGAMSDSGADSGVDLKRAAKDLELWASEKDPARRRVLAYLLIWEHRFWPQLLSFRQEAFQYGTIYARWNAIDPASKAEAASGAFTAYGVPPAPAFLDACRVEGTQEAARIPAPLTWFCEQSLAFAQTRPDDPLAPEALSRAVRSSRNANRDARSAELVLKTFRLLHKCYPNSEGARAAKVYH